MSKSGKRFGLKMGNVLGLYLKKIIRKIFRAESQKFFGYISKKKVIGNMAHREMLFYKKALPLNKSQIQQPKARNTDSIYLTIQN